MLLRRLVTARRTITSLVAATVSLAPACALDPETDVDPIDDIDDDLGKGDGGAPGTLGPEIRLTNDRAFSAGAFNNARSVVAVGDTLHVVYYDEQSKTAAQQEETGSCFGCVRGEREVYYRRSLDRGKTWQSAVRLTNQFGSSEIPAIAVSGSSLHIAWTDDRDGAKQIYYKGSSDGGVTWSADQRLTTTAPSQAQPSIAASGSFVHVVWQDHRHGNGEVYIKRSRNGGRTWEAERRLTQTTAPSLYPTIAASGADVHVAWEEYADGNGEIYYRRSSDNGAVWTGMVRLTRNAANSFSPSIDSSGGRVAIVWEDTRGGASGIYYKQSLDRGATWSADKRFTSNEARPSFAQVALGRGNTATATWSDQRFGGNNYEIFVAHTADGGTTWSADTRVSFNPQRSLDSSIVLIDDTAHVVWSDARDGFVPGPVYNGNYEMYFRQITF